MKTMIVTFNSDDETRMKRIVLDSDREDALKFVREVLGKIAVSSSKIMKNHLDK